MSGTTRRILVALTALLLAPLAMLDAAELKLSTIFGDHMVLQRDERVRIWGWANAGKSVSVAFAGQTQTATATADGSWLVELKPLAVSAEGRTRTASCGADKVTVKDVLVGDVWLGSGQSNMELELGGMNRKRRTNFIGPTIR